MIRSYAARDEDRPNPRRVGVDELADDDRGTDQGVEDFGHGRPSAPFEPSLVRVQDRYTQADNDSKHEW